MWHPLDLSSFINAVITFKSALSAFVALLFVFLRVCIGSLVCCNCRFKGPEGVPEVSGPAFPV